MMLTMSRSGAFFVFMATVLYALGFAFVAIAAVRWPSLIATGALFTSEANTLDRLQAMMNWRELGIVTGVPYFVAAFCFYSSATLQRRRARSAVIWFALGALAGFPPFVLFDFEPGWWQAPDTFEQSVVLAAIVTFFMLSAVWDASQPAKRQKQAEGPAVDTSPPLILDQKLAPAIIVVDPQPDAAVRKPIIRRPVPPAIARQRESFRRHGQKALARRMR